MSGCAGVGKSSLVNALHEVLVSPRGLFASGKFDQYTRGIPYATLVQAVQSLVRRLLVRNDAELADWRAAFDAALGPHGQLIVDLVPELKLIVGEQQPVPDLPPQEAQRRFQLVFQRFIQVFARPEHPLALLIDDLQWLDIATLDLLEHLLAQPDLRHVLVIGAYRDTEVDAAHPLGPKLKAIRRSGTAVHEIALAPLTPEDLTQLVADSLHSTAERIAALGRLVYDKTAGNALFATQFLTALGGGLRRRPGTGALVMGHRRFTPELHREHADLVSHSLARAARGDAVGLAAVRLHRQQRRGDDPGAGVRRPLKASMPHCRRPSVSIWWSILRAHALHPRPCAGGRVCARAGEPARRTPAHRPLARCAYAAETRGGDLRIVNQLNRGAALVISGRA